MHKQLIKLIDFVGNYRDKIIKGERDYNVHVNWIRQAYGMPLQDCDFYFDKRNLPQQFTQDYQAYPVANCGKWEWFDGDLFFFDETSKRYRLQNYQKIFDNIPKLQPPNYHKIFDDALLRHKESLAKHDIVDTFSRGLLSLGYNRPDVDDRIRYPLFDDGNSKKG